LASAQLTGTVLRDVPTEVSGQGSATQSTVRQVGSALGTALAGSALSVALALTVPAALSGAGLGGPQLDQVAGATRTSAGSMIAQLRAAGTSSPFGDDTSQVVTALTQGFAAATRITLATAAVFLLIGLVGALRVWLVARRPAPSTE